MDVFSQKWLFPTIRVFGPYYSNIRIIFGPKNLTEYRIEYHYSVPNYSNIRIIGTIRSNTVPHYIKQAWQRTSLFPKTTKQGWQRTSLILNKLLRALCRTKTRLTEHTAMILKIGLTEGMLQKTGLTEHSTYTK